VIDPCLSRLYTHGEKTERAVVLVHGLTNCPKQWELFAQEAYRRGWNVLVLRLPEQGLGDRETSTTSSIRAGPGRARRSSTRGCSRSWEGTTPSER
jgi:carboxylesterase